MEINLMELWSQMGLPVKAVVLVLTLQAVGCIAVTIDRLIVLYQSSKGAKQFAEIAAPAMQAGNYHEVLKSISDLPPNHLTGFLNVGIRTFLTRREAGDDVERADELTRRALERKGDQVSRNLNKGMNVLASTGSTAPFVGLLGTVLGIIHAFKLIAADGSGGIGTIGAAIGEALIVTGYGLMVAIPSVLLFNMLSSRIAEYEAGLLNAGSELVDQLGVMGASIATHVAAEQRAPVTYSDVAPAAQPGSYAQPVAQPVAHAQPVAAAATAPVPTYTPPLPRPSAVPGDASGRPAPASLRASLRNRWSPR